MFLNCKIWNYIALIRGKWKNKIKGERQKIFRYRFFNCEILFGNFIVTSWGKNREILWFVKFDARTFHYLVIKACVDYCTALCNQKAVNYVSCPSARSITNSWLYFFLSFFLSSFFYCFLPAHLFSVTRFLRILHDKTISSHSFLSPMCFSSFTFAYVPLFSHSEANEI